MVQEPADVLGLAAMMASAVAVLWTLWEALQAQLTVEHRTRWGILVSLGALVGVLALATSTVLGSPDDRSVTYFWAAAGAAGAGAGTLARRRSEQLTWGGVGLGLVCYTLAATAAFGGLLQNWWAVAILALLVARWCVRGGRVVGRLASWCARSW